MREAMQLLFTSEGFEVETARDGGQAIEIQALRPVDLLVTDLLMPDKDGIETIQHFRRDFPDVKIIAVSGVGDRVKGQRYLSTAGLIGAHALLEKPFEPSRLIQSVREVLSVSPE